MEILFITFNDINNCMYGGGQCSARNFAAVSMNHDTELIRISKRSNFKSIISLLQGNFPPVLNADVVNIIGIIKNKSPKIVFLDGSSLGIFAKKIKEHFPHIKIITFFHNVEYDYINVRIRSIIKNYLYRRCVFKAERQSVLRSDRIICLNKRDAEKIKKVYDRSADKIIPITFKDTYKDEPPSMMNPYKKLPVGIMVGSYKIDTFEGVKWFCKNVAPFIDAVFYIIGKGFEKVKSELESDNVVVIGTVDDLSAYYYYANFVCLPILNGAGMKVKTAEALMYGKYIFGTQEAFEGYKLDFDKAGGLCDSENEFIDKINLFLNEGFERNNAYNRDIFLKNFSDETADKIFDTEINMLLNGKEK